MRHNNLTDTLESAERENRKLLKRENPEPSKGDGCTLITAWSRHPATVILVEPRRMLVQEDHVEPDKNVVFKSTRDVRGKIHGFRRRLNSNKWSYASDWQIRGQKTLGVVVGERMFEEVNFDPDL